MTLEGTDNLIVQRDASLYNVTIDDMSTIQDEDLLLVQRGAELYKLRGEDLPSGGGGSAPIITDFTLAENNTKGARFTNQTFTATTTCDENTTVPINYSLKASVTGSLVSTVETSEITGIETPDWSSKTSKVGFLVWRHSKPV